MQNREESTLKMSWNSCNLRIWRLKMNTRENHAVSLSTSNNMLNNPWNSWEWKIWRLNISTRKWHTVCRLVSNKKMCKLNPIFKSLWTISLILFNNPDIDNLLKQGTSSHAINNYKHLQINQRLIQAPQSIWAKDPGADCHQHPRGGNSWISEMHLIKHFNKTFKN